MLPSGAGELEEVEEVFAFHVIEADKQIDGNEVGERYYERLPAGGFLPGRFYACRKEDQHDQFLKKQEQHGARDEHQPGTGDLL